MVMLRIKYCLWIPLPNINEAYSMVLRLEKQREIYTVSDDSILLCQSLLTIIKFHMGLTNSSLGRKMGKKKIGYAHTRKTC